MRQGDVQRSSEYRHPEYTRHFQNRPVLIGQRLGRRPEHHGERDDRRHQRGQASRPGEDDGEEILVAVNTSDQPVSMNVEVGYRSRAFIGLAGTCPTTASAPESVAIRLAPLGYAVCRATPID